MASCTSFASREHGALPIALLPATWLLAVHRNLLNQPDQARKVGRNQKAPRGSESSQE